MTDPVPDGWQRLPLARIATTQLGGNYRNQGLPSARPLIKMGNIARIGIDLAKVEYIPPGDKTLAEHQLRKGDVLLNTRNTLDLVGKVSIWSDELPRAYFNSNILRIDFRDAYCGCSVYFGYALNSASSIEAIRALATGTTSVAAVYTRDLLKLEVLVPPRSEQVAISTALTDAENLIAALKRAIAKKRAVKQGLMQQLLSGRTRLPGFSSPWKRARLEDALVPRTEKNTLSEDLDVLSCTKHSGFVRSLDYFRNQVYSRNLSGYRIICRGDIGYPANHIEEGSIGVQELTDRALVSPIYVVMQAKSGNIDTYFLQRQLKLDKFRQEFQRVTNASVDRRGSLRWREFSQIEVLLPDVREQHAISRVLRDGEAEVDALERRLAKARAVKVGMMQELLTGRTRLRVSEAAG